MGFRVTFGGSPALDVGFETQQPFGLAFSMGAIQGEPYSGPYIAVPSWSGQTLHTYGKLMLDDVDVTRIVEGKVENEAGGYTLTI